MKAIITGSKLSGEIKIPPSKSMSHRAIILASLAKEKSKITNIAYSDDIIATINAMKEMGAKINCYDNYLEITGIESFAKEKLQVDCNESGSTIRFLIPVASLFNTKASFTGTERLLERPQTVYREIFTSQGLEFVHNEKEILIDETLKPGKFKVRGDVSSQFISGLLFTLPFLSEDSVIEVTPPFESESYVNLTIQVMERFGIVVDRSNRYTYKVSGNQIASACNYDVEADFSQAAFFMVAGAINNTLSITGLSHSSKQGDKIIIDILKNAGCRIDEIANGYLVHKSDLNGTIIDLADCPDLGPILTVMAANVKGVTKLINAYRLRIKESDRIAAMEKNLMRLGVDISSTQDTVTVRGGVRTDDVLVNSFNDHRIAMAMTVLGSTRTKITLDDPMAVRKSYPNFYKDFANINGKVDFTSK